MDELIDQALDHCIDRVGTLTTDDDRMERVYATVLTPFMSYLSARFAWFIRAVQCFMSLMIVQTVLILFLLYQIRSVATPYSQRVCFT